MTSALAFPLPQLCDDLDEHAKKRCESGLDGEGQNGWVTKTEDGGEASTSLKAVKR